MSTRTGVGYRRRHSSQVETGPLLSSATTQDSECLQASDEEELHVPIMSFRRVALSLVLFLGGIYKYFSLETIFVSALILGLRFPLSWGWGGDKPDGPSQGD